MAFELIAKAKPGRAQCINPEAYFSSRMLKKNGREYTQFVICFNSAAADLTTQNRMRVYYDKETHRLKVELCSENDGVSLKTTFYKGKGCYISAHSIAKVIGQEYFGKHYPCSLCSEDGKEFIIIDLIKPTR